VVRHTTVVALYQPVFSNRGPAGEERLCPDVNALTVFSDAALLTMHSFFVGVVASLPNYHGAHAHISVFVRGAVTMACDLEFVRSLRPMATLAFDWEHQNHNCFVGMPAEFEPATIVAADPQSADRVIGTLLATGRRPANEIRLVLRPGDGYCNTQVDFMDSIAEGDMIDVNSARAPHFTLGQVDRILRHYDDDGAPSQEQQHLLALIERVAAILEENELGNVCAVADTAV
jgi:hypothetical protein